MSCFDCFGGSKSTERVAGESEDVATDSSASDVRLSSNQSKSGIIPKTRSRTKVQSPSVAEEDQPFTSVEDIPDIPRKITLKECHVMTNKFAPSRCLGEGSFGKVYRGEWKGDGWRVPVALKRLKKDNTFQGYEEWMKEILLLGRLHHPNIIRLLAYCAEKDEALLVYELCSKGNLEEQIFPDDDSPPLGWVQRVRVAQDIGRGMAYLHDSSIIHRDFKAANVLLSEDYTARITDFGLSRPGPTLEESHISTRVMGTLGYLDPAYMETGHLGYESDVFAFGVLLLEMLTGQKAMQDGSRSLVDAMQPFLSGGLPQVDKIMDPSLNGQWTKEQAIMVAIVAKHCVMPSPKDRPPMSTIVDKLAGVKMEAK